jgi:hypothetical protein
MEDSYQDLRDRVETYFDYHLHVFAQSKLNVKVCTICFCDKGHPLHVSEEIG